ncbi:Phage repressor protein C, contains Cro/C1-type HTH and peptisase s24 domains [Pseudomonas saponiphila]|uniref:Phage repressor protein C, contains Cro/C1-type HTH and peptisase s24 domains n=2 Tax=Pseudomonas saponiphila TaxID=556534 RepID=A0A1H4QTI8_9PSED|nr:helix-turn-helix transcriptional regulator [Pseudomonas saponiphila]SEC22986.1 Phage repressor protein C, contains Cro/C1-type HTH and peptisase s24 domains [Pseudomonas saponiphila]SEC26511.1 Phage repressor protein C, contains Cro/C1-type HTH and peptisase s24 domains [Pseudomonas saponiphila]
MAYKESDKTDAPNTQHPIPAGAIGCFRERLKEAMGGRAARAFARDVGLSEGAIRSYLSGDTYPTLDRLEQIAQATGVSPIWLAFGESERPQLVIEDATYSYIPLYDAKCSAGHGAWTDDARILTRLAFTTYSLRKQGLSPSNLSAIRVDGDSMEGLLSDGDTVLIDHSRTSLEGEAVYVVRLDDHLYAKRLQRQIGGGIAVISANTAYQVMTVTKEHLDDLEIIGRVVWAGGWL